MDEVKKNIVVLIKQVPEIDKVKFDVESGRLDRSSAGTEINPFDLNALEAALRMKEEVGGTVIAISMGPPQAAEALRETLARGADRAILLTDNRFAGSDTLATSFTLAQAIRRVGAFSFILCGEKTVDGDTGQVGPEVAEHLGIPHVAYVSEISKITQNELSVVAKIGRYSCLVAVKSPGLITVTKDVNTPRYLSFSKKLRASSLDIETWNFEKLSAASDENRFGINGSATRVFKVKFAQEKSKSAKMMSAKSDGIEELAKELEKCVEKSVE